MTIFWIIVGLLVFSKPLGWILGGIALSEHTADRTAQKIAEQKRIESLNRCNERPFMNGSRKIL